jgi:hypothetical protein
VLKIYLFPDVSQDIDRLEAREPQVKFNDTIAYKSEILIDHKA